MRNLETKKEIRKRIRLLRRELPQEEREFYDRQITEQVLEHPLFRNAEEIYCYISAPEEAATSEIMKSAWKSGKKVAVPLVTGAHEMEFHYIDSLRDVSAGYQGILEPTGRNPADGSRGLVILPGVAFDRKGNRIGYGKGFYDTYLQKHPTLKKLAIAYSLQCVDEILSQPHDICVETIITEKGLWKNVE